MAVVAIDATKGMRKAVLLSKEQLAELEDFRRYIGAVRGRTPSESQALGELIQDALRRFREREQQKGDKR